ncbi:zinc metalloproteinase nas-14 isoform X2 [Nematolebias whitei]|uniref:zinc metalloproteinase nas-14 isoform X2 n=1 Tax=Nematolebias whitei TaxID=451745 RepID=UPI0018978ACE|nr:zinc metalloproteinase nas-14 isoform X2 [Nematolebias whitei]
MLLPFVTWLLACSLSTGVPVKSLDGSTSSASNQTLGEVQSDMPVQEGDMLVDEDRNAVNMVWGDAIVPYEINPNVASRTADILAAFNMIMRSTCIRFQPHTNEYNYIEIKNGAGCSSFVGCRGGSQPVYFDKTCSVGNLCHELIHGLGLFHEHTRPDRDQHITINWSNIMPGKEGNFEINPGNTLNLPYDYGSIMHYGSAYFSVDGSPTIVTKEGGSIGQRKQLSQLDAQKLNALYHC